MKFIFLDADGTLFQANGTIPQTALQAVYRAQSNGHKIYLCTGRQKMEIYSDLLTVPFDGMITGSGSDVYIGDVVLASHCFSFEQMQRLVPYLQAHCIPALYESSSHLYCDRNTQQQLNHLIQKHCCHLSNEAYEKHGLVQMMKNSKYTLDYYSLPINKITFLASHQPFDVIQTDLQDQFDVVRNTFEPLGKESGEIASRTFDKATVMQTIMTYNHIPKQDTIAIGDGFNDLPMFQLAGTSIAMGNAQAEVKKMADYTTTEIDKNGIHNAFMHLHLL